MEAPPAALILDEVEKSYFAGISGCSAVVRVLQGASLAIAAGETIVLVGKAGAGKSTLLLCAAGLLMPERGRVLVHGQSTAVGGMLGTRYVANRGGRSGAVAVLAARDGNTRLLLLDDIVDVMDPCSRQELLSILASRAADGCSAILATRDELLARRLHMRVVEMRAGLLVPRVDASVHTTARVAEPRDDILLGPL